MRTVYNCGESYNLVCCRDGGFGDRTEGGAGGGRDYNVWASLQEWPGWGSGHQKRRRMSDGLKCPTRSGHVWWRNSEYISMERCSWIGLGTPTSPHLWYLPKYLDPIKYELVILQCQILMCKKVNLSLQRSNHIQNLRAWAQDTWKPFHQGGPKKKEEAKNKMQLSKIDLQDWRDVALLHWGAYAVQVFILSLWNPPDMRVIPSHSAGGVSSSSCRRVCTHTHLSSTFAAFVSQTAEVFLSQQLLLHVYKKPSSPERKWLARCFVLFRVLLSKAWTALSSWVGSFEEVAQLCKGFDQAATGSLYLPSGLRSELHMRQKVAFVSDCWFETCNDVTLL